MAENEQAGGERQVLIHNIYIKDLSFESPNTPALFREEWRPEISLHFDITVNPLAEETHEVVLTVNVTSKLGEKTAYLIEMQQGLIISARGFTSAELGPLFYVYAPSVLYPYARQGVADLVAKGGFPPLVLQHIHFEQIYAQKLAEQRVAQTGEAPSAH